MLLLEQNINPLFSLTADISQNILAVICHFKLATW